MLLKYALKWTKINNYSKEIVANICICYTTKQWWDEYNLWSVNEVMIMKEQGIQY